MIGLHTLVDKRLKAAVPTKSAWLEAWGFLLMGVGFYLALACYTFNPYDYSPAGISAYGVRNLAGPAGASAAAHILGRFGVIGMAWPIAFGAWGLLTATGFVLLPAPRRFLGFLIIAADLSGFAQLLLGKTHLSEPSFGFGGLIGHKLYASFVPQLGYGGGLTCLTVGGVILLVLTGNISMFKTAELCNDGVYYLRRSLRRLASRKPWRSASAKAVVPGGADAEAATPPAKARVAGAVVAEGPGAQVHLDFIYDGPAHGKPTAALFTKTAKAADQSAHFKSMSELLVAQLAEFKIAGEIGEVTQGPVVTTYEFKPAPGTKLSKISALGEDLARMLKAQSLRVLAPIPGKDTVGFEVPNSAPTIIGFNELIGSSDFAAQKRKLPIAMGVDIFGQPVIEDLADMPHLLVAGSTGAGKSVFMNTLIGSLIARHTAATLRLVMIDPKMVELAAYNSLPHMACPVVTDPALEARSVLQRLVVEMDERYRQMRAVGARSIDGFNDVVRSRKKTEFLDFDGKWVPMPYIVLIIDEMADMMMLLGKEIETPITRLAQKARACGIHMVIATQRPTAQVVTGLIKANFPTRVAFRVMSGLDSRTILDQSGAETLLGKGDMLYLAAGRARRLHGAYLPESEVHSMVRAAKAKKA